MQSSGNVFTISLSGINQWPGTTPRVVLGGEVATALCLRELHGNLSFHEVHSAGLLLLRSQTQLAEEGPASLIHPFASVVQSPVYDELRAIDELVDEWKVGETMSRDNLRAMVADPRWNQRVNAASLAVRQHYEALDEAVRKRSVV